MSCPVWLSGGGEMGLLMRQKDWSTTPLGPAESWPQSLRTAISIMLDSAFAMVVAWGPEFRFFYNDRYRPVLGQTKHPSALGTPARVTFPEAWPFIGPLFEKTRRGESISLDDMLIPLDRNGYLENCYFTLSYSPIRDEAGGVGGMLAVVHEVTTRVQGERRLATLRDLLRAAGDAQTVEAACENATRILDKNPTDVPFSLLYWIEEDGTLARLISSSGLGRDDPGYAPTLDCRGGRIRGWPLAEAIAARELLLVSDLPQRFGALPGGPYPEPTHSAAIVPLAKPGHPPYAVLVAGVSPRRAFDDAYHGFFELAADHILSAIGNARAFEEERKRSEALAEIDRAKTAFFSNVSHEFRTPLTLMLGPTEDALASPSRALSGPPLETVYRNELRLLRLVNALLDFARVEAGRIRAIFEPTDLSRLTSDVASVFRSAIERGGLRYVVDCDPALREVHVDREMWEKIVLNLLSNALKFTFEGEIKVSLHDTGDDVTLSVRDTGVGVPADELPRLFERFHRVEGARARTHEGSGIGLALVNDLVGLHGGKVTAESQVGRGTTFRATVRKGTAHLPPDKIGARSEAPTTALREAFAQEALSWTGAPVSRSPAPMVEETPLLAAPPVHARVLFADDNADMREYVGGILRQHWTVELVSDGKAALAAARAHPPDLVLTDVMMPGLDGFALLRELRSEETTRAVPVIMLSARAGEEARIEGLQAGADDYLVKPFSARELTARIATHLQIRRSANEALRNAERLQAALAELKELQAREAKARARAEEASRAKDDFMAMLGHELRNPLAPIMTAVQLMKLRGDRVSAREQAVIARQVQHMVRLVDDLLDVSRVTRGKLQLKKTPIELAAVVAQAIEIASPLLEERSHTLSVDVPQTGLTVAADRDRLAQVLQNLLGNAAKYTEPRGRIAITARRRGARVEVEVADTGIGIASDFLPRIFDLFVQSPQTLERSRGGLGIGLKLAQSLAALHGGTISANSEGPGKGSRFVVSLPLHASRPAEEAPAQPVPAGRLVPRGQERRLLVVDDNVDAAQTLAEALRAAGHIVEVAYDGPTALALAEHFSAEVALLDIGLPVMDGYELAHRLRDRLGNSVRMFAITGYGLDADRRQSHESGFERHMVKPLSLELLLDAVAGSLPAP